MSTKRHIHSLLAFAVIVLAATNISRAQGAFGPSVPRPVNDCGIYQWPEVQSPCPEVQIKQKHDHTP